VLLERVQHRFTHMIPGFRQLSYETRLDRLRLWTLEERRNRADLLEVFKMSWLPFHQFFRNSTVVTVPAAQPTAVQQRLPKLGAI